MGIRINTNVEAMNAQRNLGITASAFGKSVEKLSSGLRINRAADDAAGLAISQRLDSQVRGLNQAQRNAQDGISLVQTAEGALNESQSILQRMRELVVQAGTATVSSSDKSAIQLEVTSLQNELGRIANTTQYNGQNLLDGSFGAKATTAATIADGIGSVSNLGASADTYTLNVASGTNSGVKITVTNGAGTAVAIADDLAVPASGQSSTVNFSNGLSVTFNQNLSAANTNGKTVVVAGAGGLGPPGPSTIGGASGTDLVNGDVLNANSTVTATGSVTYTTGSGGLDKSGGATPLTATASPGLAAGTLHFGALDAGTIDSAGHMTVTYGTEHFVGDLAAPSNGASSTAVLTGDQGHTITLSYKQAPSGASMYWQAYDVSQSDFVFTASGTAATVQNLAAPTATAATYTITSTSLGHITLTSSAAGNPSETIAITDTLANATQTLNFATLGVSFQLHANGLGTFSKESAIGNLVDPSNNTIVVVAGAPTGGGGNGNLLVGANGTAQEQISVSIADARTAALGVNTVDVTAGGFNVTTTLASIDGAINQVSNTRAGLGAVQNRLEHTIASLGVASENMSASESRIKDLDVAAEMVNFTKTQILQQAGTAILAQANQAPQNILKLLQ